MAVKHYLAMTAAEFAAVQDPPADIAWMACHFSPYGTGLSNLPPSLPPGSLLILNDRIPIIGHSPQRIANQIKQAVDTMDCAGVLLDFQNPEVKALAALSEYLVSELPCPVAVSDEYAGSLACPVFLSPCPHHTHLQEHIAPWGGRQLWLDWAGDAETITLTKDGASIHPLPLGEIPEGGHWDEKLHCHYSIENGPDSARFTLWRTKDDLENLAREAEELGIHTLVGLYQELKQQHPS